MKKPHYALPFFLTTLLFAASGCTDIDAPENDEPTRSEVQESAKQDELWDYCGYLGWYGDGLCDDFCVDPDPDCENAIVFYEHESRTSEVIDAGTDILVVLHDQPDNLNWEVEQTSRSLGQPSEERFGYYIQLRWHTPRFIAVGIHNVRLAHPDGRVMEFTVDVR